MAYLPTPSTCFHFSSTAAKEYDTFIELVASLGKTTLHEQALMFGCLNQYILLPAEEISPLQIPSATWDLS